MSKKFSAKVLNDSCPYAMPEELGLVRRLSDDVPAGGRIMMIGAGPGVFAVAMLEGRKDSPWLYVIDIGTFDYFDRHLEGVGADLEKVVHIQGDSADKGKEFLDNSFDLIIVDGDHSYEGVSRDIAAWWGKLKPGGHLMFHDFLERKDGFNGKGKWKAGGTAKAITEHRTPEWVEIEQVGISVVFRKAQQ